MRKREDLFGWGLESFLDWGLAVGLLEDCFPLPEMKRLHAVNVLSRSNHVSFSGISLVLNSLKHHTITNLPWTKGTLYPNIKTIKRRVLDVRILKKLYSHINRQTQLYKKNTMTYTLALHKVTWTNSTEDRLNVNEWWFLAAECGTPLKETRQTGRGAGRVHKPITTASGCFPFVSVPSLQHLAPYLPCLSHVPLCLVSPLKAMKG